MHYVRINTPGGPGFQVRKGANREPGQPASKWFADGKHGGPTKAQRAAEKYIAQCRRNLDPVPVAPDAVAGFYFRWRGTGDNVTLHLIFRQGSATGKFTSRTMYVDDPAAVIAEAVRIRGLRGRAVALAREKLFAQFEEITRNVRPHKRR